MLQQYLKSNNLEDLIVLKGSHCIGDCDKGPVLKIDDQLIYHLELDQLEDTLNQIFFTGGGKSSDKKKTV